MRCLAKTRAGRRCKRKATLNLLFCVQHRKQVWQRRYAGDLERVLKPDAIIWRGRIERPPDALPFTAENVKRFYGEVA